MKSLEFELLVPEQAHVGTATYSDSTYLSAKNDTYLSIYPSFCWNSDSDRNKFILLSETPQTIVNCTWKRMVLLTLAYSQACVHTLSRLIIYTYVYFVL